jgi:putative DNA primase/helicase
MAQSRDCALTAASTYDEIAECYLRGRRLKTSHGLCLRWHRGGWLKYDGKVFYSCSDSELESDVITYLQECQLGGRINGTRVKTVARILQSICMIPDRVELPAQQEGRKWRHLPDSLVTANGIVDLKHLIRKGRKQTCACRPHTPSFVSTAALPFKFEPKARCARWLDFLDEVLPEEEAQDLLQEMFGYCLTYETRLQKFFLLEGSGANGKGVVLTVLRRLLGNQSISSVPLERFNTAHDLVSTLGKRVNIMADLGEIDKVDEGLLKQFTGEDVMHFNPKYKEPFTAKPTAKLIIATNVLPNFRDRSNGLWRRLILLRFPVSIDEGRQNPRLADLLTAELPGIFNWAVQGFARLWKRKRFVEPKSAVQERETFRRESNPARQFLEDTCQCDPRDSVSKQMLYTEYHEYCAARGVRPLNEANFAREVQSVFPSVTVSRPREDGSRPRIYKGLRYFPMADHSGLRSWTQTNGGGALT